MDFVADRRGRGGLVALFAYRMPLKMVVSSALYGAAYGLLPIGWIVFTAILLYRLTVETGKFEIIKDSIASLTGDRRLQALLIAFAFGAFLEGAAGFGTPVAVGRCDAGRAWIRAFLRRGDLSAGEYIAGGVRVDRHSGENACAGHRTAFAAAFRRRGPHLRAAGSDRSGLSDAGDGRHEGAEGGVAGGRCRRDVRGDGILHLELQGPDVAAILAAIVALAALALLLKVWKPASAEAVDAAPAHRRQRVTGVVALSDAGCVCAAVGRGPT